MSQAKKNVESTQLGKPRLLGHDSESEITQFGAISKLIVLVVKLNIGRVEIIRTGFVEVLISQSFHSWALSLPNTALARPQH